MEEQAASAVLTSVPASATQEQIPGASGDGMDVDVPTTSAKAQGKRKASEEPEADGGASKKVRMGMSSFYPSVLSRLIVSVRISRCTTKKVCL